MQCPAATGPQAGEAVDRHQGCNPAPEGRPGQHDRHDGTQAGQGRSLEKQHQHKGLGAAGANAAIAHGLKAAIACGQAIGRIHRPIHVQTATEQQAQGQHQGHLGQQRHPPLQQGPKGGLQQAEHHGHPGGESGDAIKTRRNAGPARQYGIKDPGPGQIPQPPGRAGP